MIRNNYQQGFIAQSNKGFCLTFKNGWTISVQFGPGNYCEHQLSKLPYDAPMKAKLGNWKAELAEIAAWNKDGVWYNFRTSTLCTLDEVNDVKGYCSTDEVAAWIAAFSYC